MAVSFLDSNKAKAKNIHSGSFFLTKILMDNLIKNGLTSTYLKFFLLFLFSNCQNVVQIKYGKNSTVDKELKEYESQLIKESKHSNTNNLGEKKIKVDKILSISERYLKEGDLRSAYNIIIGVIQDALDSWHPSSSLLISGLCEIDIIARDDKPLLGMKKLIKKYKKQNKTFFPNIPDLSGESDFDDNTLGNNFIDEDDDVMNNFAEAIEIKSETLYTPEKMIHKDFYRYIKWYMCEFLDLKRYYYRYDVATNKVA